MPPLYLSNPSILGMGAKEAWPELWDEISPMLGTVLESKKSIWQEERPFRISRNGKLEDTSWTFGYSPVKDTTGTAVGVLAVCTETTDALTAKKKLTESEQRFRTMAEGTSIMISVGDENGRRTYFNGAWSKFTGKKMEGFFGTEWSELIHPDDRPDVMADFEENRDRAEGWETECRLLDASGEYRWVSAHISPRFSPYGNFAGHVGSVIDIQDSKESEKEAMKFRFMADNASDPFILMSEDGSFEYVNPAALKKWGYSQDEANSLKVPDVDAIYDQKRFEALFALAQRTDVPVFDTVHRTKDGQRFPVEVKVSGFRFQGNPHMLGIARDISDRKKAKEDLRESELRFRELADQSPMWIWITNADVNVEYANRELLDYIGIGNISDFTGQVWQDIVHPDDIKIVSQGFGEAVENRKGFSVDYRVRRAATGIYEWFTVKGVPRFEGQRLTGFIGTGMNVHRQKTFLEQLKRAVELRTRELADTNVKLMKSNKELQSFAYISSHDLQEPLRKIQTFCSMLRDTEYGRISDKGREKFGRMASAANRLQTRINDLLAYSRLDMEERNFEIMELATIVEEVKAVIMEDIHAKNTKVYLEKSRTP